MLIEFLTNRAPDSLNAAIDLRIVAKNARRLFSYKISS